MDGDVDARVAHEVLERRLTDQQEQRPKVKPAGPGEAPELLPEAQRFHCPACDLVHATNAPNCYRCGRSVL